jgi:hypothetical protein
MLCAAIVQQRSCSEDVGNTLRLWGKSEGSVIKPNRLQSLARSQLKVRTDASGIHMFNRTTGLNVLLDELGAPGLVDSAPRQVSVALTNACDLACPHCHAPKNPAALNFKRLSS